MSERFVTRRVKASEPHGLWTVSLAAFGRSSWQNHALSSATTPLWASRQLNTTNTDYKISRNPLYKNITWLCQTIKAADLAYVAYALNTWQALTVHGARSGGRTAIIEATPQMYASRYENTKRHHLDRISQAITRIRSSATYESETKWTNFWSRDGASPRKRKTMYLRR